VTKAQPTPIELALVPFVSYVVSLLFSVFLQQRMTRCLRNRFLPMLLANFIIIVSSIPLVFLNEKANIRWLVYPLFALQGLGVAIMLNTATSLISDVIGNDTQSSAFVYSIFSFTEKIANGLLLFFVSAYFLQGENPDPEPIKWITAMTPIVCGLLSYGLTWVGAKYFSHKLSKITGIKR
jgi:Na+/melibiose symporter-like transporter